MGKQMDPVKAKIIKEGYFEGLKIMENANTSGASVGAVHSHTKKLEQEITSQGLWPVLEKYGLKEAKELALLHATLESSSLSVEECIRGIPLVRKLAAGHVESKDMEVVID